MSVKELIDKYGYSIAMTNNPAKTVCVIITKDLSKKDALKVANSYLKFPSLMLHSYDAWLRGDTVFFEKTSNAKPVWAISRVRISE